MHSYPKVYNLGHKAIEDLFKDRVVVQEKVDGSQFSFGIYNGELQCRSHRQALDLGAPPAMFKEATETVAAIEDRLVDGWTYRGEVLTKPKHNTLAYDRAPAHGIILFDVDVGEESYVNLLQFSTICAELGLERVPQLYEGMVSEWGILKDMLGIVSVLGGATIEGVVVKNYARFSPYDGKVLMGKYVSEVFKEVHSKSWAKANPGGRDVLAELGEKYRSEARFAKAVLHLEERGELKHEPADIGPLLKEIASDIIAEEGAAIRDTLFRWAWKRTLSRAVTRGLPEWYKEKLAKKAFEEIE